MYKLLLKHKITIPEQYVVLWEKTLNTQIDEWDWYEHFTECTKWTISTKLRSFYFQLRVADIMTNHKLVRMKIKSDQSCNWCECEDQTITHLFWECPISKKIWHEVSQWISTVLNNWLEITIELIFLHDIEAGNFTTIINLIILIVSRYIYTSKCVNLKPTFIGALKKVKDIEFIERSISMKNGTITKHNKKWRQFQGVL